MEKQFVIVCDIVPDVKQPTKERMNVQYAASGISYSEQLGILESIKFHLLKQQKDTTVTKTT